MGNKVPRLRALAPRPVRTHGAAVIRQRRCSAPCIAYRPAGRDLFGVGTVAAETALLLVSSFTCGLSTLGAHARRHGLFYAGMALTFSLGAALLGVQMREFTALVASGAGPARSAFLSSFFALAFGILIVLLLVFGSLRIVKSLNQNKLPMEQIMKIQR
jgi:cytochrome o ubiquinol oxidase subunit 3